MGLSKSDPICVIQTQAHGTSDWTEYQRTEKIENEQNPTFQPSIKILYKFEEQQPLTFLIYDIDSEKKDLSEQHLLGSTSCHLGQLVSREEVSRKLLLYWSWSEVYI
jgi:6-phosphogluconolactonase (cycloisomerase 2 family)